MFNRVRMGLCVAILASTANAVWSLEPAKQPVKEPAPEAVAIEGELLPKDSAWSGTCLLRETGGDKSLNVKAKVIKRDADTAVIRVTHARDKHDWVVKIAKGTLALQEVRTFSGKRNVDESQGQGAATDGTLELKFRWRENLGKKQGQPVDGVLTLKRLTKDAEDDGASPLAIGTKLSGKAFKVFPKAEESVANGKVIQAIDGGVLLKITGNKRNQDWHLVFDGEKVTVKDIDFNVDRGARTEFLRGQGTFKNGQLLLEASWRGKKGVKNQEETLRVELKID